MGLIYSKSSKSSKSSIMTEKQKFNYLNQIHENIEFVMNIYGIEGEYGKNKDIILNIFELLMRCNKVEEVTDDRLYKGLNEHIDKWIILIKNIFNYKYLNISFDKNIFVEEKFNHLKQYLKMYRNSF